MVLNEWQRKSIDEINTRNGLVNVSRRWPNKIVPVRLSINHTKEQHDHIDKALRTLEKVSCITFVWHTNETDFIGMRVSVDFSIFFERYRRPFLGTSLLGWQWWLFLSSWIPNR